MQASHSLNAFPVLAELLNGDTVRLERVLRAIHSALSDDMRQLDHAVQSGNGRLAREAAHRAATACHLLGEIEAAGRLAAIEKTHSAAIDPILIQRIVRARANLAAVIERTAPLMGLDHARTGDACGRHRGEDHD